MSRDEISNDTLDYKEITEILRQNTIQFNTQMFEGLNKAFKDAIVNSGIANAKETSEEFSKLLSDAIIKVNQEKIVSDIFITAFKDALAKSGLSGVTLELPPKSILTVVLESSRINRQLVKKIIEKIPPITADRIVYDELSIGTTTDVVALGLIKKLEECKPGDTDWKKFEGVCSDILTYCFASSLDGPYEQKYTFDRRQRRDMIFTIPMATEDGFWRQIMIFHGSGIIFDCKNHSGEIDGDEVGKVADYLGDGKLTKFGVILLRKGLSENGKHQQVEEYSEKKKLVVCLTDEDLKNMIKLKAHEKHPAKIIENARNKFLLDQ